MTTRPFLGNLVGALLPMGCSQNAFIPQWAPSAQCPRSRGALSVI